MVLLIGLELTIVEFVIVELIVSLRYCVELTITVLFNVVLNGSELVMFEEKTNEWLMSDEVALVLITRECDRVVLKIEEFTVILPSWLALSIDELLIVALFAKVDEISLLWMSEWVIVLASMVLLIGLELTIVEFVIIELMVSLKVCDELTKMVVFSVVSNGIDVVMFDE